jgi:hypothetical protein
MLNLEYYMGKYVGYVITLINIDFLYASHCAAGTWLRKLSIRSFLQFIAGIKPMTQTWMGWLYIQLAMQYYDNYISILRSC